jgi:hypothetical protein
MNLFRGKEAQKPFYLSFASVVSEKLEAKQVRKSIVFVMLAILAAGSFALIPGLTVANGPVSQITKTWIQLRGTIIQWGEEEAFGWLKVNARIANDSGTIRQWAMVDAMWSNGTNDMIRLNPAEDQPGSFSFSHYAARLVNASKIALDNPDYDLYIAGLWNVSKITITITIDATSMLANFNRTIEPIVNLEEGELRVPKGINKFELDITGIDMLTGFLRMRAFSIREIKFYDVNGDGKVDIRDLVRVARRFGSVPGMRAYDFDMDFNLDGAVGLGTLTTIAANIEG